MNHDELVVLGILGVVASLFVLGGVIFIASIWIAARMDYTRIHDYITGRGGRMRSCRRAFFGTGWMGSRGSRIYEIRFVDSAGREHDATCKTSMLSGVYFTEDIIISPGGSPPLLPPASERFLEEENRRLREELEKLKARAASE